MFAGGKTVDIPPRSVSFPTQPIVAAKPKPAKDIVWQRLDTAAAPGIPGISRDSTWEPSTLPGNSGPAADRAAGVAQLVQSAAEGLTSLVVNQTTSNRLDAFAKDPQILQNIKPIGPHAGVVVGVRKLQNTVDPGFPQLVDAAFFVGYGDDPNLVVKRWQLLPRFENGFDTTIQVPVYEFYWGTRDYDH